VFYALYRWMHRMLTGIPVRVGNFSVIPFRLVRRLVVVSELWNHYAAAVFKARLPRASVPTERAQRLAGKSRMNFVDLVMHGLSALSVHAELVGVRLLVVTAIVVSVMLIALLATLGLRVFTPLTMPAWTSTAVGVVLILMIQVLGLTLLFAFLVLHARSHPTFIPVRDYEYFVDQCQTVVASSQGAAELVVQLMAGVHALLPPVDLCTNFANNRSVQKLWEEFGDDTIQVIAMGVRTLAVLWASAWKQGKGETKVPASALTAVTKAKLKALYENRDFAPSVHLDEIGVILTANGTI